MVDLQNASRKIACLCSLRPYCITISLYHCCSLRSNVSVCQSLGSRPTLELFTPVPRLPGATSHCLSIQQFHLLPSQNIWRHISLIWLFLLRHWHIQQPVDAVEQFNRFCWWTLIWLSCHWAWLHQGYWHYRHLFDWFIIDVIIVIRMSMSVSLGFTRYWISVRRFT